MAGRSHAKKDLVVRARLGELALLFEQIGEVQLGLGVVRVRSRGSLEIGVGLVDLALQ